MLINNNLQKAIFKLINFSLQMHIMGKLTFLIVYVSAYYKKC